jgi:hypothetical protein
MLQLRTLAQSFVSPADDRLRYQLCKSSSPLICFHLRTYAAAEAFETSCYLQDRNEIKPKMEIIPVPAVTRVATYETDYLPTHSITVSYIKQPLDPGEVHEHESYQYDLDLDDCLFLNDVNRPAQDRLHPKQLERMLYELEVLDSSSNKGHVQTAGMCSCCLCTHPVRSVVYNCYALKNVYLFRNDYASVRRILTFPAQKGLMCTYMLTMTFVVAI